MFKFRLFAVSALLCTLGCSAQSTKPADENTVVNRRIEQKVRSTFNLPPSIQVGVGKREASEMPGYDKVPVTLSRDGRTSSHDFLVSKDNKTLIEWQKLDISKDVMESINVAGRPERGNKEAKVVIVNYDDFQCPFCSKMHQTLFPDLMKTYGSQVKIIYKDYPLTSLHPWAMHAAVDANCLAAQNNDAYWEFADYTHGNQKEISGEKRDIKDQYAKLDEITSGIGKKHGLDVTQLSACVKKQDEAPVRASIAEADKMGVEATPTLFVNGEELAGAVPEAVLRDVIDRALKDAGQTPPPPPAPATASSSPSPSASPAAKPSNQ